MVDPCDRRSRRGSRTSSGWKAVSYGIIKRFHIESGAGMPMWRSLGVANAKARGASDWKNAVFGVTRLKYFPQGVGANLVCGEAS